LQKSRLKDKIKSMSKINKDDLEHVADLARLELNQEEKAKFTEQLGAVLEYFEKLDAAKTADVKPIDQINEMENVTTDDKIGRKLDRKTLLANVPEEEEGFIKVKAVFEEK